MRVPSPTPIYGFIHVDNLHVLLRRGGLHAPNHTPDDGLIYRTIHNPDIQEERHRRQIRCGPRGLIHDYVAFYFGARSPMLYQLHTGWKTDYREGQEPLIYLVAAAQDVDKSGCGFVFSDGHGIARFTRWFDNLRDLSMLDWNVISAKQWNDTDEDPDRQRRKQAELLIHRFCDWSLIRGIAVVNESMKDKVENIMGVFAPAVQRTVRVRPEWYY